MEESFFWYTIVRDEEISKSYYRKDEELSFFDDKHLDNAHHCLTIVLAVGREIVFFL